MGLIEIEQEDTYTELTKYYKYSILKFETVFKQRHLNWDYYLNKAKKESNKGGMWSLSITDILTDNLNDYDMFIRPFYNEELNKGTSIKDIFMKFSKESKYLEFK